MVARLFLATCLALSPCLGWADCATYQQAYHVPPPVSGTSEDPSGPMGCTSAALAMFEINKIAEANAQPVTDLADLHGHWLSDAVLGGLLGITVSGQELLVIRPGGAESDLSVTQLWLKAASPRNGTSSLWREGGTYQGIVAEAEITRLPDGSFEVAQFGEAMTFGGRVLEYERSYDLFVKSQLNHFELPLEMFLHEGVLLLKAQRRDPVSRRTSDYARTYTRVSPGAAQTALAFAAVFEQSQIRFTDCLAHQITEGRGRIFDVLADTELDDLKGVMAEVIGQSIRREILSERMRAADTAEERALLRDDMRAAIEAYVTFSQGPTVRSLIERVMTDADTICPRLP